MFTLTNDHGLEQLAGDTLEDLRRQIIDYHESNRRDPQYGDYVDQFHAVYPLDESELDDDESPIVPRPLTPEILCGLARLVWDTPSVTLA